VPREVVPAGVRGVSSHRRKKEIPGEQDTTCEMAYGIFCVVERDIERSVGGEGKSRREGGRKRNPRGRASFWGLSLSSSGEYALRCVKA